MTNQFLDTSIIIGYSGAVSDKSLEGNERIKSLCVQFVINKKGIFIVCYFTIDKEILSLTRRYRTVINEVKRKIDDVSYVIGSSKESSIMYPEDVNRSNKIYNLFSLKFGDSKKVEFKKDLSNIQSSFEARVSFFLGKMVDEKVVPIKDINKEIVSIIRESIDNYADCNIFASAVQYTTEKKTKVMFVTLDKKDFTKNTLDFIKNDSRMKNNLFPELKNL
jgi:hypothetical protein